MAITPKYPLIILLTLLLSTNITVSADPPENSPAPSPTTILSPPETPPTPTPAPAPDKSPADDDAPTPPASAPAPEEKSDSGSVKDVKAGSEERKSEGMSGGQKAGIALGVIGAVFVAAFGASVYKKRQRNLQRSEYRYNARREIL